MEVTCTPNTRHANVLWNVEMAVDSRRKCLKYAVAYVVYYLAGGIVLLAFA